MESIVCAMSSALRVAVPLKSMCSTKWAMPLCSLRLVAGAARQPHADADGADVRHPLREEAETIRKHVADDGRLRHGVDFGSCRAAPVIDQSGHVPPKPLTDRELAERRHHNMRADRAVKDDAGRFSVDT